MRRARAAPGLWLLFGTSRRDRIEKLDLYAKYGVAEYWIVDSERREIRAIRPHEEDRVARDRIEWSPPGVAASLSIEIADVFD